MSPIFRIGPWTVDFEWSLIIRGRIRRRRIRLERRLADVLNVLAVNSGQVVTPEQIMESAWPGRVVTRDSVSTAIYELRKILGDDPADPLFIRTEPRKGYRLVAAVRRARPQLPRPVPLRATAVFCVLVIGLLLLGGTTGKTDLPPVSVSALVDSTGVPELGPLTTALEATLVSALIRLNPEVVSAQAPNDKSALVLEPEVVLCDAGPVLVVRLQNHGTRRYVWSRAYPLEGLHPEPNLVEQVAREISAAMARP